MKPHTLVPTLAAAALALALAASGSRALAEEVTLNRPDTGYRGIWYMNQRLKNEYRFKYSGGLGTYCAKHKPFAIHAARVKRTFFCYGGTSTGSNTRLWHMVSFYDHRTGAVPRPTILLDKKTSDAHDNPVISMDGAGRIWIFSTSHGNSRPSYIHRSVRPYDISRFERVKAAMGGRPFNNFCYMQIWNVPGKGFLAFMTKYRGGKRVIGWTRSPDGERWTEFAEIAEFKGHYQVSGFDPARAGLAGSAFNYHPRGLNARTNLYYVQTPDMGATWTAAGGTRLSLPLKSAANPALVRDYEKEKLLVYMKDLRFDAEGRPVILFLTSKGYASGPQNDPRVWHTACWNGKSWDVRAAFRSDNNYDMGSLQVLKDGSWRVIAPTATGPQPYNPGGEMVMWESPDRGKTWKKLGQLTSGSPRNHTYARLPVYAKDDFVALWADGHGRRRSESTLYFSDSKGRVRVLPRLMRAAFERPPFLGAGRR